MVYKLSSQQRNMPTPCDADDMCSCVLAAFVQALPPYTPSPLPPGYTHQPMCGETSLQHTPAPGRFRHRDPESLFTKAFGKVTVVLRGQESGLQTPWFGRDEIANGYLTFDDPTRVTQVTILVEGKLDITIGEDVSKVTTIVNSSTTLWKKDNTNPACPQQLEFAFTLPHEYESSAHSTRPLPPSFHATEKLNSYFNVRSWYRVRFSITKAPKSRFAWETTDHIFLPFDYLPRSRSRDPVSLIPGCLSNIKELPNEWYQASREVPIDTHPQLEPATTNLFIPAARTYSINTPIPFHIQVNGRVDSLRALLSTKSDPLAPDTFKSKSKEIAACIRKCDNQNLRMYIIRQVTVQLNTKKRIQNFIIGEGSLESVPPIMSDCYCHPLKNCEIEYLSWSGSLKVNPGVKTGGWTGEHVKVSDFAALVIGKSEVPWEDVKNSVGIQLVTDSWEEPPELEIHV